MDTSERYAAIQAREKDLQRREAELKRNNVETVEAKPPNFPPICPFIYHNINEDIPIRFAWTVRISFILIFCTAITLIINLIAACTTGSIKVGSGSKYSVGTNIVFAICYLILTIPIAFKINYYKLYTNCRDQNIKMSWFAFQGIYIVIHAYACVGMKNSGLIGVITMIDALAAGNGACKVLCVISGVFWILCTIGHVFLFGKVMAAYKLSGKSAPYSPVAD